MKLKSIIGAAVATAAITATLTGCSAGGPPKSAEEGLKSYFQALVDGHADDAVKIVPLNDDGDAEPLATDAVLGKATDRITDFTVGTPVPDSSDPGKATTTVSYTLGGERGTKEFTSYKTKDGVKFEDESWGSISGGGTSVTSLKVNGVKVKGDTLHAFPGTYTVSDVNVASKYVKAKVDKTVEVSKGSLGGGVHIGLSAAAESEINRQLKAHLDTCLSASPDTRALSCPNWHIASSANPTAEETTYTGIKYALTQEPTYTLGLNSDGKTLDIMGDGPGTLVVSYTKHEIGQTIFDYGQKVVTDEQEEISASLAIAVKSAKLTKDGVKITYYEDKRLGGDDDEYVGETDADTWA